VGEDVKILLDVNKLLYGHGNENFRGADQAAAS
jgi:hypothetical protein